MLRLVADIVMAQVSANRVATGEVAGLIKSVHSSLTGLGQAQLETSEAPTPAVSIRASVRPDSIACLECGARFKALKRHLTGHGLTPQSYREKWSLPDSYPMTAADYSVVRSGMAKASGLGRVQR
ncbi:MucR family transcriptional regulator [Sphingomonas sp. PAMC 26605]|uniref:MucR family transcriptional regulator n=1 Tax=Sphingomonas sp. PAMC 26605 TaxID=1112214 RepID=UPI0009D94C5C|nr:MucR family transcriptional regulator [Sphingomonas sp. PAMC 26605]